MIYIKTYSEKKNYLVPDLDNGNVPLTPEVITAQERFSYAFARRYSPLGSLYYHGSLDNALVRSMFDPENVSVLVFCYVSKVNFLYFHSLVH